MLQPRHARLLHRLTTQTHTAFLPSITQTASFPSQFRSFSSQQQSLPINYGARIVPQQSAWVVERFGKFHQVLEAGLHLLIPLVDRIAYVHSLKEEIVVVPKQTAITRDNVALVIDGVLYAKIIDPYLASYGIGDNPFYAAEKLAQTTMRSEIGKISLDKTFEEREVLSTNIVNNINSASMDWGVKALRYEIQDISPPSSVKMAMDLQAEAERRKRAAVLESEGHREAEINSALGQQKANILLSEAKLVEQINKARGEAAQIELKANATSLALARVAKAINSNNGQEAVALRVAEQYVAAFSNIAKTGTTLIVPSDASNVTKATAQAMSVFSSIVGNKKNAVGTQNNNENSDEVKSVFDGEEMAEFRHLLDNGVTSKTAVGEEMVVEEVDEVEEKERFEGLMKDGFVSPQEQQQNVVGGQDLPKEK